MLDPIRERVVRYDPEAYLREAQRVTGLTDLAETPGFRARFAASCKALHALDLNIFGRLQVREEMRWHLINRLNQVYLLNERPEIFDEEPQPPLVVVGLFRTGTTFLHNVLAADRRFRAGRTWEHMYPVGRRQDPLGDRRWRRRRALIPILGDKYVVPDRSIVHPITLDTLEEDFFHLGTDMALMVPFIGLGAWQYGFDVLDWDLTEPFEWHKRALQTLSAQEGQGRRWLLKCPWHLWHLDSLLQVYPEAQVVHIHRDVAKTVGSECSLSARLYCRMHRSPVPSEVGAFWTRFSAVGLERGQAAKRSLASSRVYDIHLSDLRSRPVPTLRALYAHFGIPFDDELADAFAKAASTKGTFGKHEYGLEDYGLSDEAVRHAVPVRTRM